MQNEEQKIFAKKKKFDWKAYGFVWAVIAFPVVMFIYSNVYLNINTITLAFQNQKHVWTIDNFKWIFTDFGKEGSIMAEALTNTLLFFTSSLVGLFLTLILSYFLFKRVFGYKLFRIVLYLPSIIGSVAFVMVFKATIGVGGPVYQILEKLLGECPEFFADSRYALWAIILYGLWTGLGGILFQGAMARIPTDVFEAAILDGIKPFKELTRIIIPMIWPTITTILILQFTGLFGAGGPILLFTKGEYKTMTIGFYLWDQIYTYNAVNTAAALGIVYTLIGTPICLLVRHGLLKLQDSVAY